MKELFDFQIGDRVECVNCKHMATVRHVGQCGTVRRIDYYGSIIGVEFDENISDESGNPYGHNLSGSITSSKGWHVHAKELLPLRPEVHCAIDDLL